MRNRETEEACDGWSAVTGARLRSARGDRRAPRRDVALGARHLLGPAAPDAAPAGPDAGRPGLPAAGAVAPVRARAAAVPPGRELDDDAQRRGAAAPEPPRGRDR